jgi:hypothetical protein
MDNTDLVELSTGICFIVDFDDMTAYNSCLDICYKGEELPESIIDNIDSDNMELTFYYNENAYDILKLTCACKDPNIIVKYNTDNGYNNIEYNRETKKINLFFKLENTAIPYAQKESIDELYYDLVETKIRAYVKEHELRAIIDALNNELKMYRRNT